MSGKVVGFLGQLVPVPDGEPVSEIVKMLEWALVEARNGNMRAVAIAYVIHDGTASPMTASQFYAVSGNGRYLENAVMMLVRAVGNWLDS
jgi:hypothetical protein